MNKTIEEIICTTNSFIVNQDREVPIPGFFIIASKDNTKTKITDFSDQETIELTMLQKKVRDLMEKVLGIKVVYFFQNEDSKHGFHIWCFPRHEWMKEFGYKIESVRTIMKYAEQNMFTDENLKFVKVYCDKMRNEMQI